VVGGKEGIIGFSKAISSCDLKKSARSAISSYLQPIFTISHGPAAQRKNVIPMDFELLNY